MPRRGENIRKRNDGRWEARYKKGIDENGKAVYGSVYGKSYREVKKKRDLVQMNRQQPAKQGVIFRDMAELWMKFNRIRLKGATEYRYRYLLDTQILPELGKKKLTEITAGTISHFLAKKLECGRLDGGGGLSPAYVRSIFLVISGIFKYAAQEGLCAPLPPAVVKPPIGGKEKNVLFNADRQKLENALLWDTDGTKLGVLISLYTGLRAGEICALTWDNIDLKQ